MAREFVPYVGPRIIPNTVDVAVRMLCLGQKIENVFQFKYTTGTPTAAQLLALGGQFGLAYITALSPVYSTTVQFIDVLAKDIGALARAHAVYTYNPGVTGTNGNPAQALNVSNWLTLNTAKTGKRFQGGKNLSGFVDADVDDMTFGTVIMNAIAVFATKLLVSYVSGYFFPAVGSLPWMATAHHGAAPAESNVITSVTPTNAYTDSAKGRLIGHGD